MPARFHGSGSIVSAALVLIPLALLQGCDRPTAPNWLRITQGEPCAATAPDATVTDGTVTDATVTDATAEVTCDTPVFHLDTANLRVSGGTPYVILQTRYADGRVGAIRAEANCPRKKLEPTALKEALSGANGALLENRMRTMSAAEEQAVLDYACSKR